MRYIGNKGKILGEIESLLNNKKILKKGLSFFDAFTGTATVAHYFKNVYKIIANDNLYFSYVIAQAKLNSQESMFKKLGFDPFVFFNTIDTSNYVGFISNNFAPTHSERMYFSDENASRIDFIRTKIEEWYLEEIITENEKYYLIASLLESISKIANVAGVYGSFLKKWDPRAVKKMVYIPVDVKPYVENLAEIHNDDIMNVIKKVQGDILYLDPPYTKNQYSTQYHLLETIALYDNPALNGKTGSRDMKAFLSDFSKEDKVFVRFEELIANANFKHIILSYSSDGIMSKEFIKSVLKRYGKKGSFYFKKIQYRKYTNSRSESDDKHCEYLFYIEKDEKVNYQSPLNFIGGKHDMVDFLIENMPQKIDTFYDLFGGGFNVGININANKIVYNDVNYKVRELLEFITKTDITQFIKYIKAKIIKLGLEKENKNAYLMLRKIYNNTPIANRDCRDLFLLIMYGFQQQIRFNSALDYNNPVGQAGFNDKVLEKLISFSRITKNKKIFYYSEDYNRFFDYIDPNDFVYVDPPYLITLGSYNDGKRGFKGWNQQEEKRLLLFLENLNNKKIKFMLSNVLEHKGKENILLKNWIEKNGFKIIPYFGKTRGNRSEIIVINYEV